MLYIDKNLTLSEISRLRNKKPHEFRCLISDFNFIKSKEMKKESQLRRVKEGNLNKYGVEFPLQKKSILDKTFQTVKEKYNVDNVFQLEEIKEKIKKTNKENTGYEYPSQRESHKELLRKIINQNPNTQNHKEITDFGKKYIDDFESYLNKFHYTDDLIIHPEIIAKKFGVSGKTIREKYKSVRPEEYNKYFSSSKSSWENLFEKTLKGLDIKYIKNYRKISSGKFEIDFYIPEFNIGFEIDPFHTHSSYINCSSRYHPKKEDYHFKKFYYYYKKNILLFNIWETDFKDKGHLKRLIINLLYNKNYYEFFDGQIILGRSTIPFDKDLKLSKLYLIRDKESIYFTKEKPDEFIFILSTSGLLNEN